MSEKRFQDAKGGLAFSQALRDKLMPQQNMAQPQDQMAQPPPQETSQTPPAAPESNPQVPPETPTPETAPSETHTSIQDLSATVQAGFDALSKLAEAVKEDAKTKKTNVTKLRDRLSTRKKKE